MQKKLLAFLLGLVILTALFFKVRDSLPALVYDGERFSYASYSTNRAGLIRFRDLSKEKVTDEDIERGVILALVENSMIRKELERRGRNEEDVKREISQDVDEKELQDLEKATSQLYGWSLENFKDFILYPQARRSILARELEKSGSNLDAWLEKSLNEANISIYLFKWKWQSGDVKKRF